MTAFLHDGLDFWAGRAPDKAALILDGTETLSYRELARWSDGIAARLQETGLKSGERVGLLGGNSFAWVAAAFGALKAGGVIVPLNERFVPAEIGGLAASAGLATIIYEDSREDQLAAVPARISRMRFSNLAEARQGAPAGWRRVQLPADAIAQIIFTSGTTNAPKGVLISHERLLAKYAEMARMFPPFGTSHIRMLMAVGLQSGLGTTWGYLFTTSHGGTMAFLRRWDASRALGIIEREKITLMPGFPLLFEQMGHLPGFDAADLASLEMAIVGGARIPDSVLGRWRAKGVLLRSMYGLTEGGNYVSVATDAEVLEGRTSCGRQFLHTHVRIVDDRGQDCPAGEAGEIFVRGPGMMIGYLGNAEATEQSFSDGWLRTGDLGLIDAEGYLHYVDRLKDMIITGGFNVSPSEIENVIGELEGELETAVIAIADDKFGEVPAAVVVSGSGLAPSLVFSHCRQRLAGFKRPRYILVTHEALPRKASGKVDKQALRSRFSRELHRFSDPSLVQHPGK